MSGRSGVRLAVGLLTVLAAGCGSSRAFQPGVVARAADKNPPGPIDNRYGPTVPATSSSSWPPFPPPRPPVNTAQTWPEPGYAPAGYSEESGLGAGQPTGEPTPRPLVAPLSLPLPQNVRQPAYFGGGYDTRLTGAPAPESNRLARPTAVGRDLELGPNETPIDRAVELARRIEQVNKENLALLARIRQLEAAAEARETAFSETLRDVQNAYDEVSRIKVEIQGYRKELAALKARVAEVEKDEVEKLKAILAAIDKLLQQSPDGKK